MGDDHPAVFQHDVGKESFIPLKQAAADEGRGKIHAAFFACRLLSTQGPGTRFPTQMSSSPSPTAAMITIGDEILSGRTRDSNMPHLAVALAAKGIALRETRVVPDVAEEIVAAVNALRARYDHVFTSGGIGPTHDDITADSVAAAFGVGIDVREDARAILALNYANPEVDLNPARLRMARIPDGATLIDNPISRAPGFSLGNVHEMAGVPQVFEAMVASLLPGLTGGAPMLSESIRVERPEGVIAGPLLVVAEAHPDVSIGCYPYSRFGANIVARSDDPERLAAAVAALRAMALVLEA